jgi:voltage-gated potassium channel
VWFDTFDTVSVLIFTVEYLARVWVSVEAQPGENALRARLRYLVTPMAIIDLLAIAPFYLSVIVGLDLRFLRVLRLLRVFKLTRYSAAMSMLLTVLREEASSFFAGFFILFVLLILASSGAYLAEQQAQPDDFGSIPEAMWWAMATLTTVGYGDVTPITPAGRLFGGMVTVVGVGMAALPAGILASGLNDHLHRRRDGLRTQFRLALEDGVISPEEETEIEQLRRDLGISQNAANAVRDEVLLKNAQTTTCPNCGHEHLP